MKKKRGLNAPFERYARLTNATIVAAEIPCQTQSAPPRVRSIGAATPGAASRVDAGRPEVASTAPAPAPTEHLEKLVRELSDKIGTALDGQATIQQDIAALREQLEHMAAERATAAKVAVAQRATLQQRRTVRPAPPAPAPTASVLSVDSWGGKPSVAILGPDGHIQFANQGDRVPGGGVIGAAQVAGQSVTIRNGDGTVSTVVGTIVPDAQAPDVLKMPVAPSYPGTMLSAISI